MTRSLAILITYYEEKYLLKECLDSLLKQSVLPDEILIYDDASSSPATNYIPQDYPVQVIRGKVNLGPGFGRNQLLKLSKCEYVHFQDADDLFHPNWCYQVKEAIEKTKADIVLTEISSYKEGNLVCQKVMGLDRLSEVRDLVEFALMGSILVPSTTFRRDIGLNIGGYRTREILPQSEDFDFHIRFAATGATYTFLPESLIIQRLRGNSHSQNKQLCLTSAIESIRLLSKDLPSQYLPNLAEASARIGSNLFNLDAHTEARKAFKFAYQLDSPQFLHRNGFYQQIARLFGQEIAEWIGFVYRKLLPTSVRQFIGKQGF